MTLLKDLAKQVRFFWGTLFYFTYAPQAWLYSRRRDRLERQFALPPSQEHFTHPGKLLRAEASEQGAHFYFEQAELEVYFLTVDLVRLDWKPGLPPIPYAIARHDWPAVQTTLSATANGWMVASHGGEQASQTLKLEVDTTGSLKFFSQEGHLLREELPPQLEGANWTHVAHLRLEECVYGLGERAARLNLRLPKIVKTKQGETQAETRTYRMWNYDAAGMYGPDADPLYISIPLYLSLHQQGSYLIFYENSHHAHFSFDTTAKAIFEGGALRYYFTPGSPQQVLERYTDLTGRASLPPRWALGYHQSRWGYRTEAAVRETVQTSKQLDLPLSAIHLDIDVQVGFRAFTIDPERFPGFQAFTQELEADNVKFITILNPGIKYSRKSNLFLQGQILDAFCKQPDGKLVTGPVWPGWCVFPDFTKPEVRRWWGRQYEYLLDAGVAGFWHDMNEPAAFILWGDRSLPKVTLHHMEGRGGDHQEAHNLYGLLQAQTGYDSLSHYRPSQRPFIVSRAGWAGLQRYAWTWTGDVECTWTALRQTIATVVGLGLSGVPYSGPDIGGFQGNPSAELYLRWFQMATFFTFYRSHCSNNVEYRAPWTYGEPWLSIIRQFLQLRYRLLPYFYTLAWEAAQKGYPPVRPLFWSDPQDANLWQVDDQFLLGDSLLICGMTEEGARERTVTLPQGRWYHFWDDRPLEGPGQVTLAAPLEQIPVLVRAGSVLPMESEQQLMLHLYPPVTGDCESVLYSDAGDGYGESRLDRFHLVWENNQLYLRRTSEGEFIFPYQTIQIQLHGVEMKQVWVDGQATEAIGDSVTLTDTGFHQVEFQMSSAS